MTLDLNIEIKTVASEGQDSVRVGKASDILASLLSNLDEGDAVKLMSWAKKLSEDGKLDIDKSDKESLVNIVKPARIKNFAKAPILEALYDLKD